MRNEQNIFDNVEFFSEYKLLRENKLSANNVEEKPAFFDLLPDLKNKKVLDLGCGFGENCRKFSEMGANYVVGIDISQKMLDLAIRENSCKNVEYKRMNMEDLYLLPVRFDVVVSSMALHYVFDFNSLVRGISHILNDGGYFIFSQEHPIVTAPLQGPVWRRSDDLVDGVMLSDYANEGKREISWLVDGVIMYHRRSDTIINTLINNGLTIIKVAEPTVSEEIIQKEKRFSRCRHAPDFFIIKSKKVPNEVLEALQ